MPLLCNLLASDCRGIGQCWQLKMNVPDPNLSFPIRDIDFVTYVKPAITNKNIIVEILHILATRISKNMYYIITIFMMIN
jgi:hypothetical protein